MSYTGTLDDDNTITICSDSEISDIIGNYTGSGDTITIDLGSGNPAQYSYNYSGVSTLTLPTIDTISLDNISSWTFEETVPFETGFPTWADFQEMCKEYPGLDQAFEKMKVFYKMCKDDWESKKNPNGF